MTHLVVIMCVARLKEMLKAFRESTVINQCHQDLFKLIQHTITCMCMKLRLLGIESTIIIFFGFSSELICNICIIAAVDILIFFKCRQSATNTKINLIIYVHTTFHQPTIHLGKTANCTVRTSQPLR